MQSEEEYNELLTRLRDTLPETVTSQARFKIPDLEVLYEGKTTVLRNFGDIVDAINREAAHLMAYLLREVGTAGNQEGRRAVFKGRVPIAQLTDRIKSYTDTFVLCSECRRPDTRLVKDGRTLILECEACGAHRPVKVHKSAHTSEKLPPLEVGKTYDVMIQDMGRKGDGIAKYDKYIIYVPGLAKGVNAKVKIEKISGTIAFASQANE
ncbi:translation initiation factor IF-2 subunit beta [[Eubacterium] cellulosolvens]